MWKGLGTNLKSGLNGLTSKISNNKHSKENPNEDEEFFDQEFINQTEGKLSRNNNNIFSLEEDSGSPSVRLNNPKPKNVKKAQKADEFSSAIPLNYDENTETEQKVTRSLPDLTEREIVQTTNLKEEIDEIWGLSSPNKKKGSSKKQKMMINNTEIEELRVSLQIKEQALGQFAEDNDRLAKEKNELKEQVKTLEGKIQDGSSGKMQKYIEESIGQYKSEIVNQVMEELNKEILQQIAAEEGEFSEEVKSLVNTFGVKPEMVLRVTENVVPVEQIKKPLYEEELLRTRIEEKEEEIRVLEAKLKEFESSKEVQDKGIMKAFEQEIEEYKVMIQAKSQDIERIIIDNDTKEAQIRSLEERLEMESTVKSEFEAKYEDMMSENKRLSTEISAQIDIIRNLETQQMNKEDELSNTTVAQEQCKILQTENENLREQITELTKTIDDLNSTIDTQDKKLTDLRVTINNHQEVENRYLDEMSLRAEETELLKAKLTKMQEELDGTNGYINRLEAETGVIPELNSKLETQQSQIVVLKELVSEKDQQIENLNTSLAGLQTIIEENQQVKENEMRQYIERIEGLENSKEDLMKEKEAYEELKSRFEALEKDHLECGGKLKEIEEKLQESEKEKIGIKSEAAEVVKKVKEEKQYNENLVDKRVLSTFLIKYYDGNASASVRQGIMETMSSLLGFSDEERVKVGLPRVKPVEEEEEKTDDNEKTAVPQKSLKQMFMSFLQDE